VLSLAGLPILFFTIDNLIVAGFYENLLQAVIQGLFAGVGATFLFARAVMLLGAGRAVLFTALVPGIALLLGYLGGVEVPTIWQIVGFVIVLIGFRLTQTS
jgi:drug/metabolite transporter (DMT)-like permease